MPAPVSKKQMRMMFAIANSKGGKTSRGDSGPPKSIAEKYTSSTNDEPASEGKGKEMEGGRWPKGRGRMGSKKKHKHMHKADSAFGAGIIVVNDQGQILLGKMKTGEWSTFGGSIDGNEASHEGAIRELKEEIGLTVEKLYEITPQEGDQDSRTYICEQWSGAPKVDDKEFTSYKWTDIEDIPWSNLRSCSKQPLQQFAMRQLSKSRKLKDMLLLEDLQKNIVRQEAGSDVVHDVTHGDSLKLIGNGVFRMLRNAVTGMGDEDFRELHVDTYKLFIRKHVNDVYSGRITDGHKQVHQFTNKSLPAVSVELMSVFEWYLPEDAQELEIIDDIDDIDIENNMSHMMDEYYKHNVTNIYREMENIRDEIRHSHAVDLQQVEMKIMKLFDKLESTMFSHVDKHNTLVSDAGQHIDEVHEKLRELQVKIDSLQQMPTQVEAVAHDPHNPPSPARVHEDSYMYLTKPQVEIEPGGKMKILFKNDWSPLERSNYLKDLHARVLRKIK